MARNYPRFQPARSAAGYPLNGRAVPLVEGRLLDKLALARPWLYYVYEQTTRAGLPSEIALLPFVESAWNPTATSRAGAEGMWQFMDGTAREYRLKTQGQCDGRQDVIQATGSAIRLLTDLRRDFGDWHLALAAYNAGATRVREAQKKNLSENKSTDFWALDSLAKETSCMCRVCWRCVNWCPSKWFWMSLCLGCRPSRF